MTLYPNLLEEIKLNAHMHGHCATAANITYQLFDVVLYEGEQLSCRELCGISYCLERWLKSKFSLKYIESPELTLFKPTKRQKDREEYREFKAGISEMVELREYAENKGIAIEYWGDHHYKIVMELCETVKREKIVSYAYFRKAKFSLYAATRIIRDEYIREAERPQRMGITRKAGAAI